MDTPQLQPHVEDKGGILDCSICFQRFKNPKELNCRCVFCHICIHKYFQSPTQKEAECPLCHSPSGNPPELKDVSRPLEEILKTSQTARSTCESCKEQDRVPYICICCQSCLCESCRKRACQGTIEGEQTEREHEACPYKHISRELLRIIHINKYKMCPVHKKDLVTFCEECQECLCNLCRLDKHPHHTSTDIKKKFQSYLNKLLDQSHSLKKKLKEHETAQDIYQHIIDNASISNIVSVEPCKVQITRSQERAKMCDHLVKNITQLQIFGSPEAILKIGVDIQDDILEELKQSPLKDIHVVSKCWQEIDNMLRVSATEQGSAKTDNETVTEFKPSMEEKTMTGECLQDNSDKDQSSNLVSDDSASMTISDINHEKRMRPATTVHSSTETLEPDASGTVHKHDHQHKPSNSDKGDAITGKIQVTTLSRDDHQKVQITKQKTSNKISGIKRTIQTRSCTSGVKHTIETRSCTSGVKCTIQTRSCTSGVKRTIQTRSCTSGVKRTIQTRSCSSGVKRIIQTRSCTSGVKRTIQTRSCTSGVKTGDSIKEGVGIKAKRSRLMSNVDSSPVQIDRKENKQTEGSVGTFKCLSASSVGQARFTGDNTVDEAKFAIGQAIDKDKTHLDILDGGHIVEGKKLVRDLQCPLQVIVHNNNRQVPVTHQTSSLDIVDSEEEGPRVAMSCGHAITPENLYQYCWNQIAAQKSYFRCFADVDGGCCDKKWFLDEVYEKACLSKDERFLFESYNNRTRRNLPSERPPCPICRRAFKQPDIKNSCARCVHCQQAGKSRFLFCRFCLACWTSSHTCEQLTAQETLLNGELKKIGKISNCPAIRACPECHNMIEHTEGCKHMICINCKCKFCFVCLGVRGEEGFVCGAFDAICDVAPVQVVV